MKEVQIDDEIRRDRKLLEDVERVTAQLDQVIGKSAKDIIASWTLSSYHRERSLRIEISDGSTSSEIVFPESALTDMSRLGLRLSLIQLWGDLLQERSHQQMAKLKEVVQSLGVD